MEQCHSPAGGVRLAGKVALVTGASMGIGHAIADALSLSGAFVGVHYNTSEKPAEELLAAMRARGGAGMLLQADLSDATQAAGIVGKLVNETGRLDILINNAGTPVQRAFIEECPLDLWRKVMDTNLTGAFVVTQHAIPHLRRSGAGAIVNILSISIQTGGANGAGPYAAAKGGLQVFTRTLARELAPQVRTNGVMPGVIETRHHEQFSTPERMEWYRSQTPLGRNGQAQEVAAAVLFLVSDAAAFINGALIDVNGGRFLR